MVEVTHHTDLQNEIYQWGAELRDSEYIHSPFDDKEHTGFGNKTLDNDLITLFVKCKNNRSLFLRAALKKNFLTFFFTFIRAHFLYPHWKTYFSFYWGKSKAANFFNNSGLAWRTAGSWLWSWYVLRKHEYGMRIIILY